jgi:hypothetical protein
MGRQNLARVEIGDPDCMFKLLWLLLTTVLVSVRPRQDLVFENCCCDTNSLS